MWRNFSFPCMTIMGKLKIFPHVEKFHMSPPVLYVKCDIQKLVHLHDPAVRITLNGDNHGLLKVNTRSLPHLWVSLDFEA